MPGCDVEGKARVKLRAKLDPLNPWHSQEDVLAAAVKLQIWVSQWARAVTLEMGLSEP